MPLIRLNKDWGLTSKFSNVDIIGNLENNILVKQRWSVLEQIPEKMEGNGHSKCKKLLKIISYTGV